MTIGDVILGIYIGLAVVCWPYAIAAGMTGAMVDEDDSVDDHA